MANIDQVQLPDGSQYHIIDDTSGYATTTYVQDQISTINKNTIGLGNVDNTADINKPVSLPQQTALDGKVDDDIVAYVENDTTATKRHEVGDQFILNGVLYTATAIIAVNDTIVIGTNCDSAESVATQITENANAIVSLRSDITSINQTGTTATQAISSGTYFYLNGTLVRAKTDIASGATFTLNTNYEVATVGGSLNSLKSKQAGWHSAIYVDMGGGNFEIFCPYNVQDKGVPTTITQLDVNFVGTFNTNIRITGNRPNGFAVTSDNLPQNSSYVGRFCSVYISTS